MHWFGGSIAEAVNLSKQKNAIFVVFVEGENDLSVEMSATLDDAAIATRLSDEANFLAIKLKSGSPTYTHFAQIYQFVPVPSLFFIGRNGTPLEVVCAGVQPDNLATRIDRIVEEHHKEKPFLPQPSTSSQDIKAQTSSLLEAEATVVADRKTPHRDDEPETSTATAAKVQKTEPTSSSPEYEVVCEGDVCVRRPKGQGHEDPGPSQVEASGTKTPEVTATESAASVEEKTQKAKELIEIRRREKAEKEKELERQKELERRSTGQGVAELKKWQADQEMKQLQEERKRERMEDNLARQRVLEQIAQDRAERRARENTPVAPAPAQPQANPNTSGDATGRARIQFKLPDGSSHTTHFEADNTLATVQTYVSENLNLPMINFAIWMAFPRQELTDRSATLRQLQLAPSAALLVLPRSNRAVSEARPGFNLGFIATFLSQLFTSLIYEPSTQLWSWVRLRLFGGSGGPASAPADTPSGARDPPRPAPSTLRYRPRTNIHRLNGDRSSDDENNTWNGNSTQQM